MVISPMSDVFSNGLKSDSFNAYYGQYFKSTTSHTDLCKCMTFEVLNQLNPIRAMILFTKPNCNLFMEELLAILKNLHDKNVTLVNNSSEIYWAYRHNSTFH